MLYELSAFLENRRVEYGLFGNACKADCVGESIEKATRGSILRADTCSCGSLYFDFHVPD